MFSDATDKEIVKQIQEHKQRTLKQNSALHLYFGLLAQALNDAGLDQRKVLKPGIDIPWDAQSIKRQLWKPIQTAMLHKEHTAELNRGEVSKVYDVLNKHLGEKFGTTEPFPSLDEVFFHML